MARPPAKGFVDRVVDTLLSLSLRRPWPVLAAWSAVAVVAACFIPGIRLELDGRSLIPTTHASQTASDQAGLRFEVRDVVVLGITGEEGSVFQPQALDQLRRLSRGVAETPGVLPSSVASLASLPRLAIHEDVLDAEPLLGQAPGDDLARRLERETRDLGLDDGILVASDGSAAAVYAEVLPEASRGHLLRDLRHLARDLDQAPLPVHLTGTALAQAILGWAAGRDLLRLLPMVIAVLALVLVLVFRHVGPALASLAEIGLSLVITAGVMGAVGAPMFVTTLVLPVILLVVGVSDDVYALERLRHGLVTRPERPLAETIHQSFLSVARPILLTTLTTVVGLLSLTATELVPQRIFGFYGSVALVLSTALTFTLMPALLVLTLKTPPAAATAGSRAVDRWVRGLAALPPKAVRRTAAVAAMAFVVVTALRLQVEDNWVRNLPARSDIAVGQRVLDGELAGSLRLELAVDSGRRDGVLSPETFLALGRVEEVLLRQPAVGAVQGPFADVVRTWAALDGRAYDELRQEVLLGRRDLEAAEIDQALLLVGSLGSSPLGRRLDPELRWARLVVVLSNASYRQIDNVLAALEEATPELRVVPFGDGWISHQAVELLVKGQTWSVGGALLVDFLLLWLVFRSGSLAALALAPVAFAVAAVFFLLAASGIPLGIANSMFAAVALGIGVDFSIHLVVRYRDQRRHHRPRPAVAAAVAGAGPAILISAVAIAAGLALLTLSEVLPNLQLGLLVCITLLISALATLALIPALVSR